MKKYLYVGKDAFIPGLPMKDLDESELDSEGLLKLKAGLDIGLYIQAPVEAPAKPSKSPKAAQD